MLVLYRNPCWLAVLVAVVSDRDALVIDPQDLGEPERGALILP